MKTLRLLICTAPALLLVGCGSGDTDPNAKVDAPGYYNGPMKPKGGGDASQPTKPTGNTAPE